MTLDSFFFSSQQLETRVGFCDCDLLKMVKSIPGLDLTISALAKIGFKYCGDTQSDSKAHTDVKKKIVCIGRDKSAAEACLSLAYEATNAKNGLKIQDVYRRYLSDKMPSMEKAIMYANEILQIEAEAVFNRSAVAISTGIEPLVKNKKYLEIVRLNRDPSSTIFEIFSEMKKNGTVHNGKKKAFDHYVSQYFEYNRRPTQSSS